MKNKRTISRTIGCAFALILCMSAVFMPVTAYAKDAPDTTPPTVVAKLSGEKLHIEASDDISGVDAVFVDGKRINYRVDSAVDVLLKDYAGKEQMVSIYGVDFAGNKSEPVQLKNPYYVAPSTPAPTTKPTTPTTPVTKPSASATTDPEQSAEQKPFTPEGQATVVDNATDEEGKEFYTFTTPNDNVFYLVIDKQRDSENVYFLNAVTESDLLALAEQPKESESAIPEIPVCDCTAKCAPGEVDTDCPVCATTMKNCVGKAADPAPADEEKAEKPAKESSGGTMIFVLLAVAAVGGAGYYFKVYKPKKDLDDAEDFEDVIAGEEPTVNEDAQPGYEETEQAALPSDSADDYPDDDYPDDEPEAPRA